MEMVLLTLMMFFAIRVGVFEQRVSSNDSRQKLAFHTAESGIHHAKEFLLANGARVASDAQDLFSGGVDGWLADTTEKRWQKCSEAGVAIQSFSATRIKKSLTGNGRASKEQVQRTIQTVLGLAELPEPNDVADAIAAAMCCANRMNGVVAG